MNPGSGVNSRVRYELRLKNGPCRFLLRGEEFNIPDGHDVSVIVRIVEMANRVADEKTIAVVGSASSDDPGELLNLRAFLASGGTIGLHPDLDG